MKIRALLLVALCLILSVTAVLAENLPTVDMIQRGETSTITTYDTGATIQKGPSLMGPLPIMPQNNLNGGAIQFAWGATSCVVNGYVPANGSVSYNLYAMQNQNFMVVLSSDNGSAVLGVSDVYGSRYLDPNQYQTSFSMYLPRTATYYVDVYGLNYGGNFSLQIFIPARVTIPVGQTKAVMDGSVGPYNVVSYTAYMYAGQTARIDDYSGAYPTSFLRVSGMSTGQVYLDWTQYMPSWYAVVPVTQDYLIEVITLDQPSNYRLTVDVR